VYEDAPHGMFITHRAEVERDLLEFLGQLGHNPDRMQEQRRQET
jgi:hypothetical protein